MFDLAGGARESQGRATLGQKRKVSQSERDPPPGPNKHAKGTNLQKLKPFLCLLSNMLHTYEPLHFTLKTDLVAIPNELLF